LYWCSIYHAVEGIPLGDIGGFAGTSFVGNDHAADWDVFIFEQSFQTCVVEDLL
jgi:hypothetical protein